MQKEDDFTQLVAYVEERTVLEERLQKMEAFRGTIKDIIFRRVQRDYATRLATIRDQFRPTLIEIVKRLKQLEAEKDKLSEKMDESNDLLSELRFRNEIGEFDETMFREQEDGLLLRLEELSSSFDNLRHTVGDYMFYLHDDKDFRQMSSAEKILERLEEDFKAERARAAEAEQARWQQQKAAPAAPAPQKPAAAPAPVPAPSLLAGHKPGGPPALIAAPAAPAYEEEVVDGELVEEDSFLAQAFARFDGSEPAPSAPVTDATTQLGAIGSAAAAYGPPSNSTAHPPAAAPKEAPAPLHSKPAAPPTAAAPPGQQAPSAPRRLPDARNDPRLQKSKVIRRAPNSGS